jgi:xanthine/uracil permease
MKPFLIVVGTVFGLIVVAHLARTVVEPQMARDPWFWFLTILAAGMSAWAWRLLWTSRASKGSGAAG